MFKILYALLDKVYAPFVFNVVPLYCFKNRALRPFYAHIIAPWLIANLLIATVGLPLHTLTCYCKGEVSVSLWKKDHNCKDEHETAPAKGCCKLGVTEKAAPSCHKSPGESSAHKCDRGCADYDQQFVKLDAEFTTNLEKSVASTPALLVYALPPVLQLMRVAATTNDNLAFGFHHPPPRPAGRDLLARVNVLIC